jgi:DNA-binding NtrC family response regulator
MVTAKSKLLTEEDCAFVGATRATQSQEWTVPPDMTLEEAENRIITATLARTRGNITEAAGILGIDRSTLYDRLKKYNIPRP